MSHIFSFNDISQLLNGVFVEILENEFLIKMIQLKYKKIRIKAISRARATKNNIY